jgi:putative salt-induced outer membrane protein
MPLHLINRRESLMINTYRAGMMAGVLTLGALTAAPASRAADANALPPLIPGWSGKGEVGYVMSTGNVNASNADAKLDFAHVNGPWKDTLHLEGLYSKSASLVSGERWAGLFQSNYQVTEPMFVFGALRYTDDKFSGFVYQGSVTVGAGYNFITTATDKLAGQVGVGYRSLRTEFLGKNASGNVIYRIPGTTSDDAVGTAEIDYEHDFNASTKLTEKVLAESGADNTQLENDLAVQVQMSRRLALSAGYSIHDNTAPPVGVKKVDTITTLNLVFQL